MEITTALLIFLFGLVAGFFNTLAGGASVITLPLLIFLGLPPIVANATNRVAIVAQNLSAVAGFQRKGSLEWRYSLWLAISSTAGSIWGAELALNVGDEAFKKILALVMVIVGGVILWNPQQRYHHDQEAMGLKQRLIAAVLFFFIGIYGGFLQAGVGLVMIASLGLVNNLKLTKINTIKVMVMGIYSLAAVIVFAINDKINWPYALVLALGNSVAAWLTSQWSVGKGETWIRPVLVFCVLVMAIKLSGVWQLVF